MQIRTFSAGETRKTAFGVAEKILRRGPLRRGATVLALRGELGAGKTTFVQGFFKGLGIRKVPASPTFILMRRTALRGGEFKNVFHADAYRLKNARDMSSLGLAGLLADPQNIFLIEWPEYLRGLLPKSTLRINFKHGKKENERTISLV